MRVGDTDYEHAVELTIQELRARARNAVRPEDGRITYKQLSDFLAGHGLHVPYHSDLMSQMLAEASRREDAEGRGMISALAVLTQFGAPMMPGAGFYSFARNPPFNRTGEPAQVWIDEVKRLHAENQPITGAPPKRAVTAENLGAWLVKCNPRVWDFEAFRRGGQALDNWSVHPSYRTELVEAGQPVLLWVTGRDEASPEPGVWGMGMTTGRVYAGEPETGDPLWLDEQQRDRSSLFMPLTVGILDQPVPRRVLTDDPRLADLEIFRQPQMSNPLWLSHAQLAALRTHLAAAEAEAPANGYGAGFADAETRRAVELAAVAAVEQHYDGWHVVDVSRQNRGWDLTCSSPRGEEHLVEVKGVSGAVPIILLTRNEARAARENPTWHLAVVTHALTAPHVLVVGGPTALAASEPFAYTVNLTRAPNTSS